MLSVLVNAALKIAEKYGIERIALISKEEFEEELKGFEIVQAPKKFATILDSMIYYFEESEEKIIAEKFAQIYRAREYISAQMYLRGFEVGRAVVVFDTDTLKGLTIFEPEKSSFLKAVEECVERVHPEAFRAVLTVALNIAQKGERAER